MNTKMTEMTFHLTSAPDSPILFNRRSFMLDIERDPSLERQSGETPYEHQLRVHLLKADYSDDGHILILGTHFRKAIQYSQKRDHCPIPPKGVKKRGANIMSLLPALWIDDIKTEYTKTDLTHFDTICCSNNKGQKNSIPSVRPQLINWQVDLKITSATPLVDRGMLLEVLEWCGLFCGIGDYRPERGGKFGRFDVK